MKIDINIRFREVYYKGNKLKKIIIIFSPFGQNAFTSSFYKNIFELALANPSAIICENLKQNHFVKIKKQYIERS